MNSTYNRINLHFSMSIPENKKVLPTPYWIPKAHKPPIVYIFKYAKKQCVIKTLSRKIYVKKSYNNSKFYFGLNSFLIIQNNKPVTDNLIKLSNPKAATFFSPSDFSTLYTNIPHDKSYKTQNFVIYFTFKGRKSETKYLLLYMA